MADKSSALAAVLPKLKKTDLSPFVRLASGLAPRVLDPFFKSLDEKERRAIDKVMPPGKGKKIYIHLTDTPTPPIVIELAQPMRISTMPEKDVKQQNIEGIRLTTDDILLLAKGRSRANTLRLLWRFKGQMPTMLGIVWMFMPLLRLGRSGLRNMGNKLTARWKPLLDLFSRLK